jgi:hypothetical protein
MARFRRIVEMHLNDEHGQHPIGIMTLRQALELPDMPSFESTHPEPASGRFSFPGCRVSMPHWGACGPTTLIWAR